MPLINVVFLLLIFFMLTGTLRPPEAMDVALPTVAGNQPDASRPDRPVLGLDPTGRIALNGRIVPLAALRRLDAREGIEIRADREVPARILLDLLEHLDEAGVPHVDLVTRRDP